MSRSILPPDVRAVLAQLGYLGFDSASEAATAILDHDDWRERWDLEDEPDACAVLAQWRSRFLTRKINQRT